MCPFKYGMIVDGDYYCLRPELARQFAKFVESGQNVVLQGERRMGKTSFVLSRVRSGSKRFVPAEDRAGGT